MSDITNQATADGVTALVAQLQQTVTETSDIIGRGRDDVIAIVSAATPIKFYDTLAQAQADVANLQEGDVVEITKDAEHSGARTRRKFLSGALAFAVNLDQLRLDLTDEGMPPEVVLDSVKPLDDYASLRNYKGRATGVMITGRGISGPFLRRGSVDIADNDGTVIKDGKGRVWERDYKGRIKAAWFGVSVISDDNKAALQKAMDAGSDIDLPPGRIKLSPGAVMNDHNKLYGFGPSPVYPYDSSLMARVGGTELYLTDAGYALDAAGKVGAGIDGIAIKSQTGGISAYGAAPAYAAGYFGVNVTGSFQFTAKNWSAHGLESMFPSGAIASGAEPTSFAEFAGWSANDCLRVFDLGLSSATEYASRDIRIADEVLALHCGQYVRARRPDGIRLENLRLFQATGYSVEVWNAPFVSFSGVTMFESGASNLLLDGCDYVTGSALLLSRAGGYTATTPWAAVPAGIIRNCGTVVLQGAIEHPGGAAFAVSNTEAFSFNGGVDTAFYTNGSQSPTSPAGIFGISTTSSANINAAVSGNGAYYSVVADYASTRGVKGSITGDGVLGQVRAPNLHGSAYVFKPKIPAVAMAAAGVSLLDTYGVTVPAGKKLVTRSWNINVPVNATLVIGGHVFTSNLAAEPNGSYKSTERYVITDNSAGSSDVNTEFNVSIRNLAGSVLNVPAGYSADIYLAVE